MRQLQAAGAQLQRRADSTSLLLWRWRLVF
jgi:hypothetical protein